MSDITKNDLPKFDSSEEVFEYGESLIKKIEYGIDTKRSIEQLRLVLKDLDSRINHLCCLLDD